MITGNQTQEEDMDEDSEEYKKYVNTEWILQRIQSCISRYERMQGEQMLAVIDPHEHVILIY